MLVVMVFWAANFIVVKAATEEIPPVAFSLLRIGLSAGALLLILRVVEGSFGLPRRDLVPILGLGALGFGAYQVLWPVALQQIPAGDSALLVAAAPVMTALLAVSAGTDVLTRTKLIGSLVSFAGVAVVIASGPGLSLDDSLVGDLLTLGAALCWSIYTAFGARILSRHSPLRTIAWAMVGGSLVLLVPGLLQSIGVDWSTVTSGAWAGLAYSAVISAGIANVVVFGAIRLLGPTRIATLQFLVPFIAVLLGAALLSEPVRAGQILGGIVIVLGVALTRLDQPGTFVGRLRSRLPG